jgi:uncharacterized protein YbcC (UPF0753/DUF2309 family)
MSEQTKNIAPDSKKINELIKKIAYMSKNGVEQGERDSAKDKLEVLCMKYGIEYNDADDFESVTRAFKYANNESKYILQHCIWDVLNDAEITQESSSKELFAVLNLSEYVEVKERHKHYWKLYKKEKESFMTAFILKNNIGVEVVSEEKENKDDVAKITVMMGAIAEKPYTKETEKIE